MRKTETFPWDPVDYLETREDMVAYLDAALEDGDAKLIAMVLGDIARAKGMAQITDDEALMGEGGLEFATFLKVTQALGFRLRAADSVAGVSAGDGWGA